MKKLLIGLVLSVAVSAPAFAEDMSTCEEIEDLSMRIMGLRQSDLSLSEVLKPLDDNGIIKDIVIDAYSQHAMRTTENALRQRKEFGVKWMLVCLKAGFK